MPSPDVDRRPRFDAGTRYAAAILAAWTIASLGLALFVAFAAEDLATRIPLLGIVGDDDGLAAPAWLLLIMATWLIGLAIIAAAARSGNRELRRRFDAVRTLRDAESRFRAFTQQLPGVAFIKDPGGRYLYASQSFEKYFGVKPADAEGRTDFDLWPADAAKFRADDERVLATNAPTQVLEETSFGPQSAHWLTLKFPIPQPEGPPALGGLSVDISAQHRAERDLLESQRRMSTLLRNLPGMAYRCQDDDQRTMEFCSSGATDLTGYAPDELVQNHRASFGHLIHPEDRERVARVIQNSLRNGVPYRLTYRITTRHGAERHVWEQGRGVSGDGATTPRILEGFVTDVTDRKRAEAEVERRSTEFRMLFDQAPMSIWLEDLSVCRRRLFALRESGVTDLRAWLLAHPDEASRLASTVRLLDVNAATLRDYMGGKLRDTLIEPGDQLKPGSLKIFVETLVAVGTDVHAVQYEGQTDSVPRDVLVAFAVVPGHETDYGRVLMSVQDVTAVKRGEAQLRAAEQRYRALFEQAPGAILVFDPETGVAVAANPAAEALLGASAAEIQKVTFHDLFVDDAPEAPDRLQHVLRTDGQQFEVRLRSLSGAPRDVLMNLRRVEYSGRRMLQAVCTDVTDRKATLHRLAETVQQLEATNADLRQLAHFVSHDFSEPLRMVAGFVQLLADRVGPNLDDRGREYVTFALEGTERMDRMIDAILRYARVGTRELTPSPVDPAAALQSALRNLQSTLDEAGAEVTCDELPPVLADEGLLLLLFQNLVANSVKYRSDPPPRVHLGAERQGQRVRLSFRDNGVGVAPADHERVFQIFQRLGTSDDIPGAGIGLAICRRVVERLGGTIRIVPASGPGTLFEIDLPSAALDA